MRTRLPLALLLISSVLGSAEVVDRMVAVVNRQVILQSEVEQTARVEFLFNGKPLDQLNAAALKATLERLIDQQNSRRGCTKCGRKFPGPQTTKRGRRCSRLTG